jgi:hypothetical protein
MKTLTTYIFAAFISAYLACGSLMANTILTINLPGNDTDTLSITLPANGAVDGVAGATVGWGFTVNWTSTNNDLVTFYTSSITADSNPFLLQANYTDYIGYQGGPNGGLLSPVSSPWTETFAPALQQGVGSVSVTTDLSVATPGAEDTGQIAFYFDVYDSTGSTQLGNPSGYSYSSAFSVTVDGAPEPGTFGLLLAGAGILATANWRRVYRR